MTAKTTLRIRFSMNRRTGDTRAQQVRVEKSFENFATAVVREVSYEYARGHFDYLKSVIRGELQPTVEAELRHLADLYKNFIVGKQRRAFRGNLTSLKGDVSSVPLSTVLPTWGDRNPYYLKRKLRDVGHQNWFEHSNRLRSAMTSDNWESYFGPIHISVRPNKSISKVQGVSDPSIRPFAGAPQFSKTLGRGRVKLGIGTVSVSVFGKITPAMLPSLIDGRMHKASGGEGKNAGLLELVAASDAKTSWHLGNNAKHKIYRPTLEPFLAFAITRAVPAAVFKKLGNLVQ